jgi:ABC-type amino acid transport substrate-binding protein
VDFISSVQMNTLIKYSLAALISALLIAGCNRNGNDNNELIPAVEARSDSWAKVSSKGFGEITLFYVPSEGFAYYNEEKELVGVTSDIFKDFTAWVTEHYGFPLHVHYISMDSWSDFYDVVKKAPSGTFGMGNVTITEARKNEIGFSPPYMTNIAVLVTHESTPELSSLDNIGREFSHLRGLAFQSTLHEERIKAFKSSGFETLEIDFAGSNNQIVSELSTSNTHFAYIDVYNFWRAKLNDRPIRHHPVGDESSEQFGYIMPLNSDWEPIFNEFFHETEGYLHTARYRYIMRRHLGEGLATMLMDQ